MFLLCHVKSRKHMIKEVCDLVIGSSSLKGTTLPRLVIEGLVRKMTFKVFHLTQQGNIVWHVCPSISLTKNNI